MSIPTTLLPFQPATMSTAQLAAVSYLARYSGRAPRPVLIPTAPLVQPVRNQRARPAGRDPTRPRRAVHPPAQRARPDGLFRRLELIRFLQVAQTITVHHGALAYLLGINALRASEAAAVRIEDYADTLRGYRVLHLLGKGNKPAPCHSLCRSCGSSRPAEDSVPAGH